MDRFLASFLETMQVTGDIDEMLEKSLEFIVRQFRFEAGSLILFEPAGRQIYRYPWEAGDSMYTIDRLDSEGHALAAVKKAFAGMEGLQTMREFLPTDPTPEAERVHGPWNEDKANSVVLPLRNREENVGVIKLLGTPDTPALAAEQRDFLELVGRQMGMELARGMILEREKALAREKQALQSIGKVITSGLDLNEVLNQIVRISSERMGLSRCALQIVDEDERVDVLYAFDMDEPAVAFTRENRPSLDFMGEAGRLLVKEGLMVYVEDARTDPRANNEFAQAFSLVSVLGVPILSHGSPIGFILMDEPGQYHRFTDEDTRIMEGIAAFAAIAIENARLYRESREQQDRLADLMLRLARAREDERSRISRELHDSMAQTLLEIIYKAEGLLGSGPDEHLRRELEGMLTSSRASLAELRRIITDLRPSSVEVLGLTRALTSLLDRFAVTYGVEVDQDIEAGLELASLYENSLFRMVQEALTNISRHASAGRARVSLRREGGLIRLEVSDDGAGFDPASAPQRGGMGLVFMRERAEMMGGTFRVDSAEGRGTVIRAEVPLGPGSGAAGPKGEGGA